MDYYHRNHRYPTQDELLARPLHYQRHDRRGARPVPRQLRPIVQPAHSSASKGAARPHCCLTRARLLAAGRANPMSYTKRLVFLPLVTRALLLVQDNFLVGSCKWSSVEQRAPAYRRPLRDVIATSQSPFLLKPTPVRVPADRCISTEAASSLLPDADYL